MASVTLKVGEVYPDGTVPIILRFIINRVVRKKTIARVQDKNFDRSRMEVKRGEENYLQTNQLIIQELAEAKQYLLSCKLKDVPPDADTFFKRLKGDTLSQVIRAYAETLDLEGSFGNANKYRSVANKIVEAKKDVSPMHVTLEWVESYMKHLKSIGNNPNTRAKDLKVISAVLNKVNGANNPLKDYKKPSNKGHKEKLTLDELKAFREAKVEGFESICQKAWMFSFYSRGMRIFDLLTLRWVNLQDGYLTYTAEKTGKKKTIRVTAPMKEILDSMDRSGEYIFPIIKTSYSVFESPRMMDKKRFKERVNRWAWRVNQALKSIAATAGITKHVTNHVARHTFAYLCLRNGMDLALIQNLLDHGSITTTKYYTEDLMKDDVLDDAVEGMFDK